MKNGHHLHNNYISQDSCANILRTIQNFASSHALPTIERKLRGRSLSYKVINGQQIRQYFSQVKTLQKDINVYINKQFDAHYVPLKNTMVDVNINIMEPCSEYRWHYDRNAVTALIYLNTVKGGELEFYPYYRFHLGKYVHSRAQQFLDALWLRKKSFSKLLTVAPYPGKLVIIRGDRCLHSVNSVGSQRIVLVFSYDLPGYDAKNDRLDHYLYSSKTLAGNDPNYK